MIEAGTELGPTGWLEIEQGRIDAFAEATEDRQSIHVDPEAAAAGPFGTTVAHGFLTLSLVVRLWNEVAPDEPGMTLNYGLNRVRFPAPVPAGSRIRGRFRVEAVEEVPGGRQATVAATIEREGSEKPVCVAELLFRRLE
jgi:acyl dehydratase